MGILSLMVGAAVGTVGQGQACAEIRDAQARLACYDSERQFGSVSGRMTWTTASRSSYSPPATVVLIPFPPQPSIRAELEQQARSPIGLQYNVSEGTITSQADGTGEFRISRVPAGRYLVVLYTPGFSMRVDSSGCAELSGGLFIAKVEPGYMFGCTMVTVTPGGEESIHRDFAASSY